MSWVCCCGCLLDNQDLNVLGDLHVTVCGGVDCNVSSNSVFYWDGISPDDFPLRTVPTNSKVFLRGLLNMRKKQILTSVIEIQKENWG